MGSCERDRVPLESCAGGWDGSEGWVDGSGSGSGSGAGADVGGGV